MRAPPSRAARVWLLRRLAVAERGRDVLERKRRALRRDVERLAELEAAARAEWESAASEAELWWQRAAVVAGERPLELARETVGGPARVTLAWRNTLGVVHPAETSLALPPDDTLPAGGSAALAYAAAAHRRALEAAAAFGAAQLAHARTARELQATTQRLRAIERRWIPEHEQALHDLQLALDERDREDSARTRWVIRRLG